jgi:adenine-specific DNA-methyltransferase
MDKLRMESNNLTEKNIEKIEKLFPNVITEIRDKDGNLKKGINFEKLKLELSKDISDDPESYDFTWVGKKASIIEANTPIRKTLRPCVEESKDWENTGNLYIEGDNLEALKLLQESYLNSIKMIYIDPPYNTGNDFIYRDNFAIDKDEYDEQLGLYDEEENRLFQNAESNGRFHSDWCSMMYPRLKLAQYLLSEDGVIFISIDDNELENLKKLCNEVLGEGNFIAQLVWQRAFSPKNDARFISNSHDYILMYVKSINNFKIGRLPRTDEANARYSNPDNDPRGVWMSSDLSVKTYNANYDYPIKLPSGRIAEPPSGRCWRCSKESFENLVAQNRIWFGPDGDGAPRIKRFLAYLKFDGMAPTSILLHKDVGHSQEGSQELTKLLEAGVFDGPKPIRLMRRLLTLANTDKDSIILDFFSGSATTAHAVMQLNAEDGGNRKFIMVNLPELCDEKSEAYKAGYKNICDIGKERIRRAGEKIKSEIEENNTQLKIGEEPKKTPDIGFRVLKVDSTNMKDVYYSVDQYNQNMLEGLESNIKEDRTDLDLLYGVMLDWGLQLSLNHKIEQIDGINIHTVDECSLVACFADRVPESVVMEIAKRKPLRVVFKDSSFKSSPEKINVEEIFKLYAPGTSVKVI